MHAWEEKMKVLAKGGVKGVSENFIFSCSTSVRSNNRWCLGIGNDDTVGLFMGMGTAAFSLDLYLTSKISTCNYEQTWFARNFQRSNQQ